MPDNIMGFKKPDNLKDESELEFSCDLCKDKHWIEFKDIKQGKEENGDILVTLKHTFKDGVLVEEEIYKQRCECYIKEKSESKFNNRIEKSGLELLLKEKTFKTYTVSDKWQKDLKDLCINFVNEPSGMLALLGGTGSGKTHLGTATSGNLAYKGYEVLYLEWANEMEIAKNNYYKVDEEKLKLWQEVDVLYIDDLFKVRSNDITKVKDIEFISAWSIIDRRFKRNKITIISSEFTLKEMYRVDRSFAGRIAEYSKDNIVNIDDDVNKNYRMRGIL